MDELKLTVSGSLHHMIFIVFVVNCAAVLMLVSGWGVHEGDLHEYSIYLIIFVSKRHLVWVLLVIVEFNISLLKSLSYLFIYITILHPRSSQRRPSAPSYESPTFCHCHQQ